MCAHTVHGFTDTGGRMRESCQVSGRLWYWNDVQLAIEDEHLTEREQLFTIIIFFNQAPQIC